MSCATPNDVHAPPLRRSAFGTIAHRIATFRQNDAACPIRRKFLDRTTRVTHADRPIRLPSVISQAALASGTRTGRAGAFGGFATRWALLLSAGGGLALFASF